MFFKHSRWRKTRSIHRIIPGKYQVSNKWFLMSKLALHFYTAIKVSKCIHIICLRFITHKKTKYFLILYYLSVNSSPQFECTHLLSHSKVYSSILLSESHLLNFNYLITWSLNENGGNSIPRPLKKSPFPVKATKYYFAPLATRIYIDTDTDIET